GAAAEQQVAIATGSGAARMTSPKQIVRRSILAITFIGALAVGSVSGQSQDAKCDTLKDVLDRMHEHAANDAWRQEGWADDPIERWLIKITAAIAKAADDPDLKLPIRFSDVKPVEPTAGRTFDKALLTGKNINLRSAQLRNCIVLADGNVEVDGLEG